MSEDLLAQMLREHLQEMDRLSAQHTSWALGLVRAISEGKSYDIPDAANRPDAGDAEASAAEKQTQQLDGAAGRPIPEEDSRRTTQDISGAAEMGAEPVGQPGAESGE